MKSRTKWIIAISAVAVIIAACAIFIYDRNSVKVFTQSEYVKEVIIQKTSFDDLMDKYLDQVRTYDASRDAAEKVQTTANRLSGFVSALEEKLGPKVPHVSKEHYDKMMAAYKTYLEAVEIYRKAVAKNLGDEKTALTKEAEAKLLEARRAMDNLG